MSFRLLLCGVVALAVVVGAGSITGVPRAAAGQTFTLNVGGGVPGVAADDFFPDTVTIHTGDDLHFVNPFSEIHTVTFETAGTASPAIIIPGATPPQIEINPLASTPTFTGTAAVTFDPSKLYNTGIMQQGAAADVVFPSAGTYTFVCLVHGSIDAQGHVSGMSLTVNVVNTSIGGNDTQQTIDARGSAASAALINKAQQTASGSVAVQTVQPDGTSHWAVGVGQSIPDADVMQYLPTNVSIKTGDTINWTNGSLAPHTVTFTSGAADPALFNPVPQTSGPPTLLINPQVELPAGGKTYDGTGFSNSGLLQQGTPLGTTYSLTFTKPGVYQYHCLLHATEGMIGTITVTGAALPASTSPPPAPAAAPSGVIAAPNTGTGPGGGSGAGSWLPALLVLAALGAVTGATGLALSRWRVDE